MEVFEAALAEATTRWETAQKARQHEARLSKVADTEAESNYHRREATKMQNEAIKYAAAVTALTALVGK